MSAPLNSDPRIDQAAVTDESLLAAHEVLLGKQPDEKARYKLGPLNLLFVYSGLIFFAGTYLNRYSGHFDPLVYDENAPPTKGVAAATGPVDPVVTGGKLYNNPAGCVVCHLATGQGQPGAIPPLAGSEWVTGSEERAIRIVLYGLQGPITVKGATYNAAMPAFGRVAGSGFNWADDRVAHVLTYIRQEWGNQAGPVSVEKVTEIRTKEGDHKPYTAEELLAIP
jgi:mono/diheme cytochrome c family protein